MGTGDAWRTIVAAGGEIVLDALQAGTVPEPETVDSGLRSHPADVVVLAGDDRSRHLIEESLEGVQLRVVHVTAGGRAPGRRSASTTCWTRWCRVRSTGW